MRTLIAILLLATAAMAAPVPKEVKKPGVTHGVYQLKWSGRPFTATLNGNGEFSEFESDGKGQGWVGRWSWDEKTRTLMVDETRDDGFRLAWTVVLDPAMTGKTDGGVGIELRPFR